MEKNSLVALVWGAVCLGSLASCNEELEIVAENSKDVEAREFIGQKVDEFTSNFISRFGQPDPNHSWGMGTIPGNDGVTRGVVANKNQWVDVYHLVVPGLPDTYLDNNGVSHNNGEHWANSNGETNWYGEHGSSDVPAGDVTDEEVKYVSWWFRTHRYPTSLQMHWTDFYIQEVSSDYDRDVNGNVVNKATILKKTGNEGTTWEVDGYETVDSRIDHLHAQPIGTSDTDYNSWTHINNFNSGASNGLYDCVDLSMENGDPFADLKDKDGKTVTTNKRLIDFYESSGTENFMAHYSSDNRDRTNYDGKNIWVLVHLHFVGQSGRVYDGYYLAFDLASFKQDTDMYTLYEPDGYYSNWIVKLSPAKPIENNGFTRRVMCEDLGNTYDFDFDDVVFDVTYNVTQAQLEEYKQNSTVPVDGFDATITLQAAGGTMPIVVGKDPSSNVDFEYEAHRLFGYDYTVPVNVNKDLGVSGVVNYHVTTSTLDPKDIGIWVYNTKKSRWYNYNETLQAKENYSTPASDSKSIVPQRFAVPNSVLWLKETHQIEQGYPDFAKWVADQEAYDEGGSTPWFTSAVNGEHLCGFGGVAVAPSVSNQNSGLPGTTSASQGYKHTLTTLVNDKTWGTVSVDKGTLDANGYAVYNTTSADVPVYVKVTAHPADGKEFWYWSINNPDADNGNAFYDHNNKALINPTLKIEITKDIRVLAVFKPVTGAM